MDLNDDGDRGERGKTPKGEPGSGGASGGAHGCESTVRYDLDPRGCATSLDQLVAALCEAFLEGGPQCSRKRK